VDSIEILDAFSAKTIKVVDQLDEQVVKAAPRLAGITRELELLLLSLQAAHWIHGDIQPGNLVVRRGECGITNFDDARFGHSLEDIVSGVFGFCTAGPESATILADKARQPLLGYSSLLAMPDRHLLIEILTGQLLIGFSAYLPRWELLSRLESSRIFIGHYFYKLLWVIRHQAEIRTFLSLT